MLEKQVQQSSTALAVEFIGGPFDGHRQSIPRAGLNNLISLPVNREVFKMIRGKPYSEYKMTSEENSRRRATYRLWSTPKGYTYRFESLQTLS